jgi:hypothetical protein
MLEVDLGVRSGVPFEVFGGAAIVQTVLISFHAVNL